MARSETDPTSTSKPAALRQGLYHTAPIVAGKGIQFAGSLLFVALVPRLMGPETYGSFAVYVSLLLIFSVLGDLGALLIYGRYVPIFRSQGDERKVSWLFSQFFWLKALIGVAIGVMFIPVGKLVLPNWPGAWWLGAATLVLRLTADNCYHLAYGLDRTGLWVARESLRSLVQLLLVMPLYYLFGLPGTPVGLLLADLVFLLLGLSWSRRYLTWQRLQPNGLSPYLRYGLYFFGANLCLIAFQRGGDVLLAARRVTPANIAYYNLAFGVFLVLYITLSQMVLSTVPTLVRWQHAGEQDQVATAINLLWKLTALGSMAIILLSWTVADLVVPLAFGIAYRPVAGYLNVIILSLLPLALGRMSLVIASVYQRPTLALQTSVAMLVTFLAAAAILVPTMGIMGLATASVIAMGVYALATYWLSRPLLHLTSWRKELTLLTSSIAR